MDFNQRPAGVPVCTATCGHTHSTTAMLHARVCGPAIPSFSAAFAMVSHVMCATPLYLSICNEPYNTPFTWTVPKWVETGIVGHVKGGFVSFPMLPCTLFAFDVHSEAACILNVCRDNICLKRPEWLGTDMTRLLFTLAKMDDCFPTFR